MTVSGPAIRYDRRESVIPPVPQQFTSFDGTAISYTAWGSGGTRPPGLLNHGFDVDTKTNWQLPGIVDVLVAEGFAVVGMDARGHGLSEKPHDPARYGEDAMAKDVSALLDELGVTDVDIVGYSMGAIVSIIAAIEDNRVRSLVAGGVGRAVVERGGLDTRTVSNIEIAEALIADEVGVTGNPRAEGFRTLADMVGADLHALSAAARAARSGPLDLDRITARTLILAGTEDPLAESPNLLASAIAGAELVEVTGDHLATVLNPSFVDAITTFLKRGSHHG